MSNQISANMGKKSLESLAKAYEVEDFCEYLCETWLNGNKKSAVELFHEMKPKDKLDFMNELNYCTYLLDYGDGPWQMDFLHDIIYSLRI